MFHNISKCFYYKYTVMFVEKIRESFALHKIIYLAYTLPVDVKKIVSLISSILQNFLLFFFDSV